MSSSPNADDVVRRVGRGGWQIARGADFDKLAKKEHHHHYNKLAHRHDVDPVGRGTWTMTETGNKVFNPQG
eukprot:5734998-Pyramimonas_sp.AAC.4